MLKCTYHSVCYARLTCGNPSDYSRHEKLQRNVTVTAECTDRRRNDRVERYTLFTQSLTHAGIDVAAVSKGNWSTNQLAISQDADWSTRGLIVNPPKRMI